MAEFVWRVSRAGYEWQMVDQAGVLRTDAIATTGDQGAREYHPLSDEPLLFRRFADLPEDPAAYIAFANRFGHLTAGVTVIDEGGYQVENDFADRLRWPNGRPEVGVLVTEIEIEPAVETKGLWWSHVTRMRGVIRMWERAKGKVAQIGRTEFGKDIIAQIRHRVVPWFDEAGALSLAPTDLLSALWLQFARAVGGGRIHRQCPHCGTWFEVSVLNTATVGPRRSRRDKVYCSCGCRMAAAYARRSSRTAKGAGRRGAEDDTRRKGR